MLNKKMIFFATPPEGEKVGIDWYEHWRRKPTAEKTYDATPLSNLTAFELIRPKVIKVDEMITHRFPLKEIAEGFRVASEGKNCLNVIIKPNEE